MSMAWNTLFFLRRDPFWSFLICCYNLKACCLGKLQTCHPKTFIYYISGSPGCSEDPISVFASLFLGFSFLLEYTLQATLVTNFSHSSLCTWLLFRCFLCLTCFVLYHLPFCLFSTTSWDLLFLPTFFCIFYFEIIVDSCAVVSNTRDLMYTLPVSHLW